jgi:pimeloyl-ACP methyl ester carboxylesterase
MAIYLAAVLPVPGLSFDAQHVDFSTGFKPSEGAIEHPDGGGSWPERGAIEVFFHDCDPDVASASAQRLRKQHWRISQEVTPLRRWPDVRSAYILCTDDRVVSPAYSRRAARDLLGVEAVEMAGGHSPFLSRPRELATLLIRLVD